MPNELPVLDITGWVVVGALVLISMVRGWLVAASQVERLIAAYERVILDKDKQIENWQKAFENSDARADILAENQRIMLDAVKTTNTLIQDVNKLRPIHEREIST
jgi:hypothetical protein